MVAPKSPQKLRLLHFYAELGRPFSPGSGSYLFHFRNKTQPVNTAKGVSRHDVNKGEKETSEVGTWNSGKGTATLLNNLGLEASSVNKSGRKCEIVRKEFCNVCFRGVASKRDYGHNRQPCMSLHA